MSPDKKVIRHNEIVREEMPEIEGMTDKKFFNLSVGEEHRDAFDSDMIQLKPTGAFVSLLIALKYLFYGGAIFLFLAIISKLV